MKTIIAPVDFSSASTHAAEYAADLAAVLQAELLLLNVVQVPLASTDGAASESIFEEMLESANESLDDLKKNLAARTKELVPISVETLVGTVEHQVELKAAEKSAIAVVMGITASTASDRLIFGSHALFAARHLPFPLLLVPETARFGEYRRIGMACDLLDTHSLPFEKIRDWIQPFDTELHILHVGKSATEMDARVVGESVSLHNRLNRLHPHFHFISDAKLEVGLRKSVEDLKLDMLMVFPKTHGLLDIFAEKHSKKIILEQTVPVLVVHEKDSARS